MTRLGKDEKKKAPSGIRRIHVEALLLISLLPKNISWVKRKSIKDPVRQDKEVRTMERRSRVSWSERKRAITADGDDRSSTSECDADEQNDEGKR